MNDLEKSLKEHFPNGEFSREIPSELKNDKTITLRVNSTMVSELKEIAAKKDVSYQFLIKDVLWRYIDLFNNEDEEALKMQQALELYDAVAQSEILKNVMNFHQKKKIG